MLELLILICASKLDALCCAKGNWKWGLQLFQSAHTHQVGSNL